MQLDQRCLEMERLEALPVEIDILPAFVLE
jgi:hypothetical protein